MNRVRILAKLVFPIFCCFSLSVWGHVDDPKVQDQQPAYEGPGFRASDARASRAEFPSEAVTLLSWITVPDFGPQMDRANDCWGYVSGSGREYAIIGLSDGTGFVEISDPTSPVIVAVFDGPASTWRDIKVMGEFAYAVSEGGGGIQIFNLSQIDSGTITQEPSITGGSSNSTHNVALNTDSGYLYRCGGSGNGLRIYDLTDPVAPQFVAEWPDRYVHDAQVVSFTEGPNAGREIAFCCGGFNNGHVQTGLSIVDVTDKTNIFMITHLEYDASGYSHQGWLSPDKNYFYLNDELDERNQGVTTTTRIIDVSDLSNPFITGTFTTGSTAIDHNLYTRGNRIFEANYRSGLRVFDSTNPEAPEEVGFFDTYPDDDNDNFNGLWSCYPYFPSGTVIGSDIERGLFIWSVNQALLSFSFPDGLPPRIAAAGDSIRLTIKEEAGVLDPTSPMLLLDAGQGQVQVLLENLGETQSGDFEFIAHLPAMDCNTPLTYFFSADTLTNETVSSPAGAPGTRYNMEVVDTPFDAFDDNFEGDLGWAQNNALISGDWVRAVPIGGGNNGVPLQDGDSSGSCMITGNGGANDDIDGGSAILTSPAMDASYDRPILYYYRWFYNGLGIGSSEDTLLVEVSDDNGNTWRELELVGPEASQSGGGWIKRRFDLSELPDFALNQQLRLRFTAGDNGPDSQVEAGIDGVILQTRSCDLAGIHGDLNRDGLIDGNDLGNLLPQWHDCSLACSGDLNQNGEVNILDCALLLELMNP